MQYVPCVPKEGHHLLDNGVSITYDNTHVMKLILGGDQLTAACVRGTQALRVTEEKVLDRLQGLVPVVEDWYARMAFTKVHRFDHEMLGYDGTKCMPDWFTSFMLAQSNL